MRVVWSEAALADRKAVAEYFGQYNLAAALKAGNRIEERVNLLADFPYMGRAGRFMDTRELAVPQVDCVIVYRLHDSSAEVLRIVHSGQEWSPVSNA